VKTGFADMSFYQNAKLPLETLALGKGACYTGPMLRDELEMSSQYTNKARRRADGEVR
jgi:hypothetical protein